MGREKRRAEPLGAGSFKTAKGKTDGENSGKSRDQTLLTRIRTLPAKCLRSSSGSANLKRKLAIQEEKHKSACWQLGIQSGRNKVHDKKMQCMDVFPCDYFSCGMRGKEI